MSATTTYSQHPLVLPSLGRGSHLITPFIQSSLKKEIEGIQCGLLHLFVQHTSCALSLNENWDEDVRRDMSDALDKMVVEDKVRNLLYFPQLFFLFRCAPKFWKGRVGGTDCRGEGLTGGGQHTQLLDVYSTCPEPRTSCLTRSIQPNYSPSSFLTRSKEKKVYTERWITRQRPNNERGREKG